MHEAELIWRPRTRGDAMQDAFLELPAAWRFLLIGGLAAAVNVSTRFSLTPVLGFEAAVPVAYLTGMWLAYTLFRRCVFSASGRSVRSEVWRFSLVNLVALLLVWTISVGLAREVFPAIGFTWHAEDIAHLIGVLTPAASSWIGHKRYTFSSR